MQILTGGSFVKLENKERIEALIFTAKEMANAAVETSGFVNESENNKRIALEIWQGAEYMTLDHEEAQVKNLFVNNFLDRLREIGGTVKPAETVSENTGGEVNTPTATSAIETSKDEFLGLVSTEEIGDKSAETSDDSVEAQGSENGEIAVSAPEENSVAKVKTDEAEMVEPAAGSTSMMGEAANQKIAIAEPEGETVAETIVASESAASGDHPTENSQAAAKVPGAIVLPEKEPYRWEKCTVTATIQLLPTADDSDAMRRKAVLSARTHDFAPQFAVVELGGEGEELLNDLLPALGMSLEKYKADLPLKVMEKMKREKSAPKKNSAKTPVAATTNAAKTSVAASQPKPDKSKTEKVVKTENTKSATTTTVAPKPIATVPAASGQQGSLFNF